MKNKTEILKIITYAIILSSISILLNDMREFDFNQFKQFHGWAKSANKNDHWLTSQNAIQWSYYIISAGLFFMRGYLIYGFTYFISILNEIEKEHYFTDKNILSFKKIGSIFITYTINVLVLKFLMALINRTSFSFLSEFKEEFTYLIPAGLAFYILSEVFKRAKETQEENDLTI